MSYQPPFNPSGQPAPPPGGAYGAPPQAYAPPNAYGPPGAYRSPFANAASASGPLVVFAAISAALPLAWRGIGMLGLMRGTIDSYRTMVMVERGVDALVHLVTIILFFVWIYRLTSAIRATQGTSAYSPGMAVGAWFIPCVNFVLPFFTMRDAWKRAMHGPSGADPRGFIVPLWWATYLLAMLCSTFFGLDPLVSKAFAAIGNGGLSALGWVWFFSDVATWGSLVLMVRWITERTAPRHP